MGGLLLNRTEYSGAGLRALAGAPRRGNWGIGGPMACWRRVIADASQMAIPPACAGFCVPRLGNAPSNMAWICEVLFCCKLGLALERGARAGRKMWHAGLGRGCETKKGPVFQGLGVVAEAYRSRTYHGHLCPPPVLKTGRHTGDETLPRGFGVSSRIGVARQDGEACPCYGKLRYSAWGAGSGDHGGGMGTHREPSDAGRKGGVRRPDRGAGSGYLARWPEKAGKVRPRALSNSSRRLKKEKSSA